MDSRPEDVYSRLLAQQGITLPPGRAEALARTLAAQLQVERAATRELAFELEPSTFTQRLEGNGQ